MIIRCLHHLLPLREGGKEVIISHPNSLLHKGGSHTPVSGDNSQYSVGSACFIPLPKSNWKRLVSPVCLYRHGQRSRTLQTLQLKPSSSFWAIPRAPWRDRAEDYQSHHLPVQSVGISLWDHHKTTRQTPPSHLLPNVAQQLWKQAGIAVLPSRAAALFSEIMGWLPPASRNSKSRTGVFTLCS